ncbi:MFS transporter [Alicyclobacillus ferrooxydans]|uniref:MFS transporter n=1 Tax=Alicyclobacillus ferrooxydans TaxID=471514 RepID=A0A0P9GRW4_9BACL|nr:MFS transporter [Alicyclobacillus ferrooxydans]KPV43779.1 MFS transporter [Alicyclobacillus ferrooxydans]
MGGQSLLRINRAQITLLVILNLFVGGMVGLERTVLPLVAKVDFGLLGKSAAASFIISFGVVKAVSNLFAGQLADSIGRRQLLILGWVIGIPIPFIVMFAPNWYWIIFANVLLGINQGFCWSMTVNMKIDLAGSKYRGLVVGLNEFAGYFAISMTALISGYIAANYGVRPQPFYLGVVFAAVGLLLSVFLVKNTEVGLKGNGTTTNTPFGQSFMITSWKNKQLFSVSQAGFMTNFKDGMAWGLFPLFFADRGLALTSIAVIVAVYPGTWGVLQLLSGPLSDRMGRKWLIVLGMLIQGLSIIAITMTHDFTDWLLGAIGLGLGTALVYPVLIAAVSDLSEAESRASTLGVYRFWRDFGYAAGALVSGILADHLGTSNAMWTVGILAVISSLLVTLILRNPRRSVPELA